MGAVGSFVVFGFCSTEQAWDIQVETPIEGRI
jgi:hypothetical protein